MYVGNKSDPPPFIFDATALHFVLSFPYLGSTMSSTADLKTQVSYHHVLMQCQSRPTWWHWRQSRETKQRVYNASVSSVLMCGSEKHGPLKLPHWHAIRLPEEHPIHLILDFDPKQAGWNCPMCAPGTRWLDVMAQDRNACNETLAQAQL